MEKLNEPLIWTVLRLFLTEILVSGLNFFVLMNKVYQPRWGESRAHQIGMATRMIYIFAFAYQLDKQLGLHSIREYMLLGMAWLLFILVFEWGGSFLMRRPVKEILVG